MPKAASGLTRRGQEFDVSGEGARRQVKRPRIHEEVTAYLLQDIQNGVYAVGEMLPSERAMMASFGVGRPAVRESLAKLARLGVIELKAGVRPRVRRPDVQPLLYEMKDAVNLVLLAPEGQRHMEEVRALMESSLARHAARRVGAPTLAALRENIAAQSRCLDDMTAFADLDMAFHRLIANESNNPILLMLQAHLADWLFDIRVHSLKKPGQAQYALEAHKAIYQALETGDVAAAGEAMEAHLQQVGTSLPRE